MSDGGEQGLPLVVGNAEWVVGVSVRAFDFDAHFRCPEGRGDDGSMCLLDPSIRRLFDGGRWPSYPIGKCADIDAAAVLAVRRIRSTVRMRVTKVFVDVDAGYRRSAYPQHFDAKRCFVAVDQYGATDTDFSIASNLFLATLIN
ncbi:hypothetical protein [Burkholderia diffusa]|uniref:hypothetical protein n=1 Tax=Burkholderia diffusa TaxID=488732 RepID=UPI0015840A6A|nr:hypothetical protein [Burkholderia diffusa]